MNVQEKIVYLIADYTIRVIGARTIPACAEFKPMRSDATITATYCALHTVFEHDRTARKFYNVAFHIQAAQFHVQTTHSAFHREHVLKYAAHIATVGEDFRELLNRAINPEKYW